MLHSSLGVWVHFVKLSTLFFALRQTSNFLIWLLSRTKCCASCCSSTSTKSQSRRSTFIVPVMSLLSCLSSAWLLHLRSCVHSGRKCLKMTHQHSVWGLKNFEDLDSTEIHNLFLVLVESGQKIYTGNPARNRVWRSPSQEGMHLQLDAHVPELKSKPQDKSKSTTEHKKC